jgi:4-alpha-glucanotransferase
VSAAAIASPRGCGVLLHASSLPGSPVCGSFGASARDWIALLSRERVGSWQLLPLSPTDATGSPYSSPSGSALNPWFLDADDLVAEGWLREAERDALPGGGSDSRRLDPSLADARAAALRQVLQQRLAQLPPERRAAFQAWQQQQRHWLRDHCRFMVLRQLHAGLPWWQWPAAQASRQPQALAELERDQAAALQGEALVQWLLQTQWQRLQRCAHEGGVRLVGDLPFYVAHDSVDAWCRPELFALDRHGALQQQSGVPPDYFSPTGQLWGTPVYRWWRHRLSGFRWWLQRLERQLSLFDLLRLDHFRALQAFWSIPGGDATAEHGVWRPSPGWSLLALLWWRCCQRGRLLPDGRLPLIAEDLGVITPPVEALRDRFGLPGMKILQFAFDGNETNPYLPANFVGERWVVYTGTHDNATSVGWWQGLDPAARDRVAAAVGGPVQSPAWQLLELGLASTARLVVVPLQDLLELGDEARFNTPGTTAGNWSWRLDRPLSALEGPIFGFGQMAARYGRAAGG